ncbi:MAG TPA: hypothetical protein VJR89_02440 [Polyangiales bacterium]|nr:hypothetical protein [Polyangiales bacterium]
MTTEVEQLKHDLSTFIAGDPAAGSFNALALRLYRWHLSSIPRYRAFCASRLSDPWAVEDYRAIPPLPVEAFKHGDLSAVPKERIERRFSTSGTTRRGPGPGKRGVSAFDRDALEIMDLAIHCNAARNLFPDAVRCRVLVLAPHPDDAPHMIMAHGMRHLMSCFGDEHSGFFAGKDGLDLPRFLAALERACEERVPVCLIGASFGFVHLIDTLQSRERLPIQLPPGSRLMDAGGYKGRSRELQPEEFRELTARSFGLGDPHIVNLLGMTELSSQIYDDVLARQHAGEPTALRRKLPPHWVRTHVTSIDEPLADAAEGEVGILAHYDLANFSRPFAVLSDDLGRAQLGGFRILSRIKSSEPRGCSVSVEELWRQS